MIPMVRIVQYSKVTSGSSNVLAMITVIKPTFHMYGERL